MRVSRRQTYPRQKPEHRSAYRQLDDVETVTADKTAAGAVNRTDKIRDVNGDAKVRPNDFLVRQRDTAAATTIYLPDARLAARKRFRIEDGSGGAGDNTITVKSISGQTIDGGASATIEANYGAVTVRSDGRNWFQED